MKATLILILLILPLDYIKPQPYLNPELISKHTFNFGGNRDRIYSAIADGNDYTIMGRKGFYESGTFIDYPHLCKLTSSGELLWDYTGSDTITTSRFTLVPAPDGVFWGISNSQWPPTFRAIYKVDNDGNISWMKELQEGSYIAAITSNDGLLAVTQGRDIIRVSILDFECNPVVDPWYVDLELCYNLILNDSSLYIVGVTPYGILYTSQGKIIKTDFSGNIAWQDTLMDVATTRATIDKNGDLYVCGYYLPESGLWLTIKYDVDGNRIWQRYETGTWIQTILPHPNGGCVVVGDLIKLGSNDPNEREGGAISYDSQGEVRFRIRYDAKPDWYGAIFDAALFDNDNHLVIFGHTWDEPTISDFVLFITKWDNVITIVEDDYSLTQSFSLAQNYPNPFNPNTKIKYQIPEISFIILKVYDVLGNEVATLVDEEKPSGIYEVEFNAIALPSGVYFYVLQSRDFIETKKMILLK